MNDIQIFDIYDIWYEPPWFIAYKNVLIIVLGLVLFLALLYYWYRKRLKKQKPCWDIALENLKKLDTTNPKCFYYGLTALLKNYLGERYALNVLSKTDLEMVEYLEKNTSLYGCAQDLKKIFSQTTYIKFSDDHKSDSLVQEHLKLSMQIIRNTIEREQK